MAGYRDVLASISANYDFCHQYHPLFCSYTEIYTNSAVKLWAAIIKIPPANHALKAFFPYAMPLNKPLQDPVLDPLLLIPLFMVDFLNIAPSITAPNEWSRLLLALLLYRSGYEVEQYSSIDAILLN